VVLIKKKTHSTICSQSWRELEPSDDKDMCASVNKMAHISCSPEKPA